MKLLRMALPRRMWPRSIFFFPLRYVRVCTKQTLCAQIFAELYTLAILYSGVENIHRFHPAGSKKKLDLYPACILMNPKLFLRFLIAPQVYDRVRLRSRGMRDGRRETLPLHFAFANTGVVFRLLIVRRSTFLHILDDYILRVRR